MGDYGLEFEWNTGIECKCGGEIRAFPTHISEKWATYGFRCPSCKISGKWNDLARGYFEYQRRTAKEA